jgi:hypothetical protein
MAEFSAIPNDSPVFILKSEKTFGERLMSTAVPVLKDKYLAYKVRDRSNFPRVYWCHTADYF